MYWVSPLIHIIPSYRHTEQRRWRGQGHPLTSNIEILNFADWNFMLILFPTWLHLQQTVIKEINLWCSEFSICEFELISLWLCLYSRRAWSWILAWLKMIGIPSPRTSWRISIKMSAMWRSQAWKTLSFSGISSQSSSLTGRRRKANPKMTIRWVNKII